MCLPIWWECSFHVYKVSLGLSHVRLGDFFLDTDVIPSHWDLRRGVSRHGKITNKGRELLLRAFCGYQIVAMRALRQFLRAGAA